MNFIMLGVNINEEKLTGSECNAVHGKIYPYPAVYTLINRQYLPQYRFTKMWMAK